MIKQHVNYQTTKSLNQKKILIFLCNLKFLLLQTGDVSRQVSFSPHQPWFTVMISCLLGVIALYKPLQLISRLKTPLDSNWMWLSIRWGSLRMNYRSNYKRAPPLVSGRPRLDLEHFSSRPFLLSAQKGGFGFFVGDNFSACPEWSITRWDFVRFSCSAPYLFRILLDRCYWCRILSGIEQIHLIYWTLASPQNSSP